MQVELVLVILVVETERKQLLLLWCQCGRGGGGGAVAAVLVQQRLPWRRKWVVAVAIQSTCQLYNSSCLLTTIKRGDSLWQVLFTERIRMTLPRTMPTPDDLPKQVQVAHDRSRNYEEKGELRLWFMVIYTTLTYRPSSRVARGNNHLEMQLTSPRTTTSTRTPKS